jgi:hypothetical protein
MNNVAVTLGDAIGTGPRLEAKFARDLIEKSESMREAARRAHCNPQSLNGCYRIVTNRRRMISKEHPGRFVGALSFGAAPLGYEVIKQAWPIHDATKFGWWDCLPISSALRAAAKDFREDPQHERQPEGITLLNPFRLDPLHQLF